MSRSVDLNSDLGEGFGHWRMGDDDAMLDIVTSINLACGFHAGDPSIMDRTIRLASARGIAIGAHPSFWDLVGFGRREMPGEDPAAVERQCVYQIGGLAALARAAGARLSHVKAHGALYNQAARDPALATSLARAVAAVDPALPLVVLPGSRMEQAAREQGLAVVCEIFADRAYGEDGQLLPRRLEGAVIHDPAMAAERVVAMVRDQAITTVSGRRIEQRIDTICVHGDSPAAVKIAAAVRAALAAEAIEIRAFAHVG